MNDIKILIVEDNKGDVRLIEEALKESKIINKFSVCEDGEEALLYLNKEGIYRNVDSVDLILLDLNLPKKSGIEVLKALKNSKKLRKIPVIILTTSDNMYDIREAYDLGVNSYLTKPVQLLDFIACIKAFSDFWLTFVKLPTRS